MFKLLISEELESRNYILYIIVWITILLRGM